MNFGVVPYERSTFMEILCPLRAVLVVSAVSSMYSLLLFGESFVLNTILLLKSVIFQPYTLNT